MTTSLATGGFGALLDVAVDAVIIIDHQGIIETLSRCLSTTGTRRRSA